MFYCASVAAQFSYIPAKSPITLVYKITDAEAGKLYRSNHKSLNEKMIRNCVDTLQGVAQNLPEGYPDGHFLLISAQGNNLNFKLVSIVPFEHRLLNNQTDMTLSVFDRETGKAITNATVKVGNKRLKFDEKTQSYRRSKTDKQGILSIEANGITSFHTITRQYDTNLWRRTKSGLWNVPVVKYVSRPVIFVTSIPMDIYRSIDNGYPYGSIYRIQKPFSDIYNSIVWGNSINWFYRKGNKSYNTGFMVFSKPKYRPNDTIRFKAYVVEYNGKPVKDSMNVYIRSDKERKIATIAPYRPGFFTMDFVPKPEYGMKLDKNYELYLYNRKTRQGEYFYYEDYELLQNVEYNIRSEKEEYLSHEEIIFYAKAVDENNMPVMDARVELTLLADFILDFNGQMVRVPDVLWKKELNLDPVGETKIVVSDSIWLPASISARLIANFNNSDNRTGKKEVRFVRKNTSERFIINQHADNLNIQYENNGQLTEGKLARINSELLGDTLVVLPFNIKIHPLVEKYTITSDFEKVKNPIPSADFIPSAENSGIFCSMYRANDSIFITVENPLNLPLIYTIYKGNKEKQRGTGNLSTYKNKASKKSYFLSVQYIWGGKEHKLEYRSVYNKEQLQLNPSLPAVVFPGQTVKINILATDNNGNPVPDVDLTAWGYTVKFGDLPMPKIPNYQKPPTNRKPYNSFKSVNRQTVNRSKELDLPRWQEPLKLDSVELYKFAYPEKEIYRYSFPSADKNTYIAPYLVHNGKLLPIQILYINDRPVYFGRSTTDMPYVFPVSGGLNSIRIRTSNYEVKFQIFATRGYKTIYSIDPYFWKNIPEKKYVYKYNEAFDIYKTLRVNKKKNEYSTSELNLLRNYQTNIRYQPSNKLAWLQYGNTYELLKPVQNNNYRFTKTSFITGPIRNTSITLWEENDKILTFERDPSEFFEYEPLQGILKMRSIIFSKSFDYKTPRFDWETLPYTKQYVDSINNRWNFERNRFDIQYNYKTPIKRQLQIETTLNDTIKNDGWCWILYNYKNRNSIFFPLDSRSFVVNSDGYYALLLLMADKTFYKLDSIPIETGITTILNLPIENMEYSRLSIDSYMEYRSLFRDINTKGGMDVGFSQYYRTTVLFNPQYNTSIVVCGRVTDGSDGTPIPGASVQVKGTNVGTVTDLNGNYCIQIPVGYRTLVFSFIGLETEERTPLQSDNIDVALEASSEMCGEVVVVAYGLTQKRNFTFTNSVQTVAGRAAGIQIKGVSSLDDSLQPLYIVDAKPIDAQDIMKQILEDELYQSGLASAKGMRSNFSDEALWQPSLVTDNKGIASFTTTFPDDVTKWELRFAGIIPGKVSATSRAQVRSLKLLMGQLSVPRFMVEGDTANVIGKIINYGKDTVRLNTDFAINGVTKASKSASVRHSLIDTLAVGAPEILYDIDKYDFTNIDYCLDSIAVSYQLTSEDGYQDGEERQIPIYRRGIMENIGQFHVLDADTTITLSFDSNQGSVTLSLESSSLDILLQETRRLRDYRHLCNEQTASRLKALLLERKAYQLLKKDYPYDKHINSLIERLVKERNEFGLWGWFGGSVQETWISTHVTEALLQARDDGFKTGVDFENITNRLIISFDASTYSDRIRILRLLIRINPQSNYREMFDKINIETQKNDTQRFYTDLLRWMELSLYFGENPDIEAVLKRKITDKLGNIHWSEFDDKYWRYNNVSVTLAAYRLLRTSGGHEQTLRKIRNYLFTQRNHYGWLNTYETADILSTIMPDILASGDSLGASRIRISGSYTALVDTFPKQIILTKNEPVTIDKKGAFPVYLTASQQFYLREPEPANEGFRVETKFTAKDFAGSLISSERNRNEALFSAGKPVTLEITVYSNADSEYVVIEIPIPAGCSYQSKPQTWYRGMGETHREYFRDRVCIYLRLLQKGSHTFQVELMPRFTGVYYVNPAKAERMYMPLYYGRSGMKMVGIRDSGISVD